MILVAHAGKQHAYRHAAAIQHLGMLGRFVTSSYYKPQRVPDSWLGRLKAVDAFLRLRHLDELDPDRVVRNWWLELPEFVARQMLGAARWAEQFMFLRDARFDHWVACRWAGRFDMYWGFQGSCLESLQAAKTAGSLAVAEFAAAHVTLARRLLSLEAQRHPEWVDTLSGLRFPAWYQRRLEREPHEADICIVASQFARRSLLDVDVPADRIAILPLGVDLDEFSFAPRSVDGPLRVLFVGSIGQHKGIKYLLEACRRIRSENARLVLVGAITGSGQALRAYQGMFEYRGRLGQRAVAEEMRRCHVLVLPSLSEGFGLVIPEAMATGMPVIASTHTVAPEMIREGQDGFVLEPDDVDGLAAKLDWLASHRHEACEMGCCAAARAKEFSWQGHSQRLADLIERWIAPRTADDRAGLQE